jgi:hypothetical protein
MKLNITEKGTKRIYFKTTKERKTEKKICTRNRRINLARILQYSSMHAYYLNRKKDIAIAI